MTTKELELREFDRRIAEAETNLERLLEQRREFVNRNDINKQPQP